mmetsp:Transcript_20873/g.25276  ORF Transcript_20873/g.25276 Transcript_20873/m.25276 type:complete len:951 (-) Transcript_20873:26-2878(-)
MEPVPEALPIYESDVSDNTPVHGSSRYDYGTAVAEASEALDSAFIRNVYYKLMYASQAGDEGKVKKCLVRLTAEQASALDSRPNFPSYGESPLHRAKTPGICNLLITKGVSVNVKGRVKQTPLHAQCDNLGCAAFLIENGATVDALTEGESTPLLWATVADCLPVVKLLVRHGANVNHQNCNGNTALHICPSVSVAKYLIGHGARLDLMNINGNIPLEEAAARGNSEEQVKLASYLLDVSHDLAFDSDEIEEDVITNFGHESLKEIGIRESSGVIPREPIQNINIHKNVSLDSIQYEGGRKGAGTIIEKDPARRRWEKVRMEVIKKGPYHNLGFTRSPRRASRKRRSSSMFSVASSSSANAGVEEFRDQYDEFYLTFFELMVRDRPELALKILDKQRSFLYAKNSTKAFSYNISLIGTPTTSSTALRQIIEDNRRDLVAHDVVQWVLNVKWVLFTRYSLAFEFVRYLLFTILFVITSMFGQWSRIIAYPEVRFNAYTGLLAVAEISLFLLNLLYIANHMMQLYSYRHNMKYFYAIHNGTIFPVYLFVAAEQLLRVLNYQDNETVTPIANIVGSFAAVLVWLKLFSFGESFQIIGVMFCTVRKMIYDIIPYFALLCCVLTGFSHAMALLYRDEPSHDYGTIGSSWITFFFFVFNLDVSSLNEESSTHRKYVGYLLTALYMLVVALVITNLIIAVMTNTFEEIQKNSREEWLLQRARVIFQMEDIIKARFSNPYWGKLPEGDLKVLVFEESDGTVQLQVPTFWLQEVVRVRDSGWAGKIGRFMYSIMIKIKNSFLFCGWFASYIKFEEDAIDAFPETSANNVIGPTTPLVQNDSADLSAYPASYKTVPTVKEQGNRASNKRMSTHFSSTDAGVNRTGVTEEISYIGSFPRALIATEMKENDEIHEKERNTSKEIPTEIMTLLRSTLTQIERFQAKIVQLEAQQARLLQRLDR